MARGIEGGVAEKKFGFAVGLSETRFACIGKIKSLIERTACYALPYPSFGRQIFSWLR